MALAIPQLQQTLDLVGKAQRLELRVLLLEALAAAVLSLSNT
jgi:hypothetical protein